MPLWGEPYNENGCKEAWRFYYSRFNSRRSVSHREAAKYAGVNVAEMYCFGLDKGLIDPGHKEEALSGLEQLKKL